MTEDQEGASAPDDVELEMVGATPADPLGVDALRWTCDPARLQFDSTADIEPLAGVIGQEHAMDALQFGLAVSAPGQNIFVRGLSGTGRMTLVRRLLREIRPFCPNMQDRCYVQNFRDSNRPRLITLPRGTATGFRRRIDELADFVTTDLGGVLESDVSQARRRELDEDTQKQIDQKMEPFEATLKEAGLALVNLKVGATFQAVISPVVDGEAVTPEQWRKLRSEGKVSKTDSEAFEKQYAAFQAPLREVLAKVDGFRRQHAIRAGALREAAVRAVLEPQVAEIEERFRGDGVADFLAEVVEDVATEWVRGKREDGGSGELRCYRVGVIISHDGGDGCPIVVENTPSMRNLLGTIDQKLDGRAPGLSDHLMIRAGSILRADGGYLILEGRDVVREPGAWKVLLRTLRTGYLELVPAEMGGSWWSCSLQPEPIKVNLKVILIGDEGMYHFLDEYDPDFHQLFKVLADFESEIPLSEANIEQYAGVLARIGKKEGLPPFDRTAVAALAEHGARIAGRHHKLTTRFGRLADLAREAAFLTSQEARVMVTGDDVRLAIRRTRRRAELPSRRFQELLSNGMIRVATSGKVVGQVNGLAVTQAGPLTFGFPARITAAIGPGSAGVINIERESNLSGSVHTKGFYILGGLLRTLLRTEHPLAFHASVAFEQSYGGIDGDSASCAEICCLLSALTEIPIRQDLAITGAIDQMGNILAIGAVNEKIEGFFDTCQNVGLTGTHGVIIPEANRHDLMLRHDVVKACGEGKFHVYTVSHVREAFELLMGVAAGERGEHGLYPPNTVLGLSVVRAFQYWTKAVQGLEAWSSSEEEDESDQPDSEPNARAPVADKEPHE